MYKRLHSSVPDSLKLGKISDFAFRCWTVGLSQADWYGRLNAEPEKFVVQCFPNRREVTAEQVRAALDELADVMGEGLIHLYRSASGKEYLVFHRNEEHNPRSTHSRVGSSLPPPPKGLCDCVKYGANEGHGPFGGREFRFYPGLFDKGDGKEEPGNGGGTVENIDKHSSAPHAVHVHADALHGVHDRAGKKSLPLLSCSSPKEEGGTGGSGGGIDEPLEVLGREFSDLTGRKPWRSEKERLQLQQVVTQILENREVEALVAIIRDRISRDLARGKNPPASLSYFGPIFADHESFNKVSTISPQKTGDPPPAGGDAEEIAAYLHSRGVVGTPSQLLETARGWLASYKRPSLLATLEGLNLAGVDVYDVLRLMQSSQRRGDPSCSACRGTGEDRTVYAPGSGRYAYCVCTKPVKAKDRIG